MQRQRITPILSLACALVSFGCAREQDEPQASGDTTAGNETAESQEDTAGTTVAMPGESTTMDDPSADSTGDSGGPECEGPDGCWACAPTTPVQGARCLHRRDVRAVPEHPRAPAAARARRLAPADPVKPRARDEPS